MRTRTSSDVRCRPAGAGIRRCAGSTAAQHQQGIGEVRGDRRHGHRQHASSARWASSWPPSTRSSRSRSSSPWATTSTARTRPRDFKAKFEAPVCRAARGRDHVPCGSGQPRQHRAEELRALQHERPALLHVPRVEGRRRQDPVRGRALFRFGQQLHGPRAAPMAGARAVGVQLRLEDRLLPPPPVLFRTHPRLVAGLAQDPGAPVHALRRQRGLQRPRPHLRASEAAAGHHVLRDRVRGFAAQGRLPPRSRSPPSATTPTTSSCWWRSTGRSCTSRPSTAPARRSTPARSRIPRRRRRSTRRQQRPSPRPRRHRNPRPRPPTARRGAAVNGGSRRRRARSPSCSGPCG